MPKKGRNRKSQTSGGSDFTLDDSANAPKAVRKLKKAADVVITPYPTDVSWDQLAEVEDFDLVEEVQADGTKSLVYKKKQNHSNSEDHCVVYPEIVWYLVSHYIKPEDIGRFAAINHATYAITKRESFWRNLYRKYCCHHKKLPERLQIENSFQVYGLRQRVIRALFHTYNVFVQRVALQALQECRPHELVGRRCVNMWYSKGGAHWVIYFKLKKVTALRAFSRTAKNMIEELGRLDANPEEDTQVLQVSCRCLPALPPVMGLTLSAVSVALGAGLRHRRLHLGLGPAKAVRPDCWLLIDHVIALQVLDWWHPLYPHYDTVLRPADGDDAAPFLDRDFFE